MLTYICDNCGEKYDAEVIVRGVKYKTETGELITLDKDTDPCVKCLKDAEDAATLAKEEALKKRKNNQQKLL